MSLVASGGKACISSTVKINEFFRVTDLNVVITVFSVNFPSKEKSKI
jgi:hypothetical protein